MHVLSKRVKNAFGFAALMQHKIWIPIGRSKKFCVKANPTSQEQGLQSKHDLGFPLNYHAPVGGDSMRAEGMNAVSAHGKNIKRGSSIMQFP